MSATSEVNRLSDNMCGVLDLKNNEQAMEVSDTGHYQDQEGTVGSIRHEEGQEAIEGSSTKYKEGQGTLQDSATKYKEGQEGIKGSVSGCKEREDGNEGSTTKDNLMIEPLESEEGTKGSVNSHKKVQKGTNGSANSKKKEEGTEGSASMHKEIQDIEGPVSTHKEIQDIEGPASTHKEIQDIEDSATRHKEIQEHTKGSSTGSKVREEGTYSSATNDNPRIESLDSSTTSYDQKKDQDMHKSSDTISFNEPLQKAKAPLGASSLFTDVRKGEELPLFTGIKYGLYSMHPILTGNFSFKVCAEREMQPELCANPETKQEKGVLHAANIRGTEMTSSHTSIQSASGVREACQPSIPQTNIQSKSSGRNSQQISVPFKSSVKESQQISGPSKSSVRESQQISGPSKSSVREPQQINVHFKSSVKKPHQISQQPKSSKKPGMEQVKQYQISLDMIGRDSRSLSHECNPMEELLVPVRDSLGILGEASPIKTQAGHSILSNEPVDKGYPDIENPNTRKYPLHALPFVKEYVFKLACVECLEPVVTEELKLYHNAKLHDYMLCSQDILLLKKKASARSRCWKWIRSRPQKGVSYIGGKYTGCISCKADAREQCPSGSNCMYAHSKEEYIIWNDNRFSLSAFLAHHRKDEVGKSTNMLYTEQRQTGKHQPDRIQTSNQQGTLAYNKINPNKLENIQVLPLKVGYAFKLACLNCMTPIVTTNMKVYYTAKQHTNQSCKQDILLVQNNKYGQCPGWLRIRQHPTDEDRKKKNSVFVLCKNIQDCTNGMNCTYAHSIEECSIWNAEQCHQFSMAKFISQNQKATDTREVWVDDIGKSHPRENSTGSGGRVQQRQIQPDELKQNRNKCSDRTGVQELPFIHRYNVRLACVACLQPMVGNDDMCMYFTTKKHYHDEPCGQDSLLLMKETEEHNGRWLLIREQPQAIKYEQRVPYKVCPKYTGKPPEMCFLGRLCLNAHSIEERTIWNCEKYNFFNLAQFIQQRRECLTVSNKSLYCSKMSQSRQFSSSSSSLDVDILEMVQSQSPDCDNSIEYLLGKQGGFLLACKKCVTSVVPTDASMYYYAEEHVACGQNILLVPKIVNGMQCGWLWLREQPRKKKSDHNWQYDLCTSIMTTPPVICSKVSSCVYAHSHEELLVWNLEKAKKFNIDSFITKNRILPEELPSYIGNRFRLACSDCLQSVVDDRMHVYYHIKPHSSCSQQLLLLHYKPSDGLWIWIRPLPKIKKPTYPLCSKYSAKMICYNGIKCTSPHSGEERTIWNCQVANQFNLERFIRMNKQVRTQGPNVAVSDQVDSYEERKLSHLSGTSLRLPFSVSKDHMFCLACMHCLQPIVTDKMDVLYQIDSLNGHKCDENMLLVIYAVQRSDGFDEKRWKWIRPRPVKKCEQYMICPHFDRCRKCDEGSQCCNAHGKQELLIWQAGQDGLFQHAEFIQQNKTNTDLMSKYITSSEQLQERHGASQTHSYMTFVCGKCWDLGVEVGRMENRDYCNTKLGLAHGWVSSRIALLYQNDKTPVHIHQLPPDALSSPDKFECRLCPNGEQCNAENCQHPHNLEEAKIWKWQIKNRGKSKT